MKEKLVKLLAYIELHVKSKMCYYFDSRAGSVCNLHFQILVVVPIAWVTSKLWSEMTYDDLILKLLKDWCSLKI